ncbi:MAG: hybrid sensor histidine kinase/response regulator [Rickettsiales bacterium]|nr:hybrid sensor histidine kinase/response regulator [Rickettsiales bacterium]
MHKAIEGSPTSTDQFHILLVDDDEMDREYYANLLSSDDHYSYDYETASSLKEAQAKLRDEVPYDCVLLDYSLGDGTGEDLLHELRGRPDAPAIVVFTGQTDQEKGLNLLRMGAHDYIDKAKVNKDMLSRAIRFGIERARGSKLMHALQAEQKVSELQSDFISIITHEFKNPIHVINNSVHFVRKKASDHLDAIDKYLTNIDSSTGRMENLLQQTAEFAKFDPAALKVEPEQFCLYTTLQQMIEQYEASYRDREFCLGSSLSIIPEVYTDRRYCEQIVDNIIGNAIKYSPDGTSVNFLLTADETHLHLQVQDHGRGIPEKDLEQIGKKFFRASNVEGVSGTGLGLYLVQSLMPILNGRFEIKSRENFGTVITLSFPTVITPNT